MNSAWRQPRMPAGEWREGRRWPANMASVGITKWRARRENDAEEEERIGAPRRIALFGRSIKAITPRCVRASTASA